LTTGLLGLVDTPGGSARTSGKQARDRVHWSAMVGPINGMI
jgi:hypothetical protein